MWIVEFLWSHLENNPLLCVEINYKLKATIQMLVLLMTAAMKVRQRRPARLVEGNIVL